MKIRFNKFEKVAGLFVGLAALSCVVGMAGIAVKQGWFSSRVKFFTELESADGVHSGTVVQIAGLRVGSVTEVDLQSNDKVLVQFEVLEKFKNKIRQDSHVQMFRPFVLADKVLEVSVGSEGSPEMAVGGGLPMQSSSDIMDLLSGKKMGAMLSSFDKLADSLKIAGEAFADPQRTHALVQMIDRLNPLVQNLNTMSVEVVKLTSVANKSVIPALQKEVPDIGQQLGQLVNNTNTLMSEMQKLTPAIAVIAPELPRTTRRAVEALDETVVVLKALQKSFLLRGNVEDVRKEENRRPANTSEP
jgi:phospholipid/cholesterol/gamma-HCH transport system substrate-binding protein